MEEFTKTLFAFQFGPDDVHGGTAYVFSADTGGGYARLYGSGGEILPALDNDTFMFYAGIWFMCSSARELWRDESRKTKHHALERRWMFYYALGEVFRTAYEGDGATLQTDFRKLAANPVWIVGDANTAVNKVVSRTSKLAFNALRQAYEEASGKVGFTHRNWFRSEATLHAIRSKVTAFWHLVSEHGDDYRVPKRTN